MALAVTPSGDLFAGDMQRGLLRSRNSGRTWSEALNVQLAGLAVSPRNPKLILAAGPGVFRSADVGHSWKQVLQLQTGAGPVAWSPSVPSRAYVVGFDRTLHRSDDNGSSWQPVNQVSSVWTLLFGLCALACPLSMAAMMWMTRRGRKRGGGDER